jgi:hypothetical protein
VPKTLKDGRTIWRMPEPCVDCPFNASGPGRHLRDTLRGERWRGILRALRSDGHFICHKTGDDTGDGSQLVCAGSIAWQEAHGLSSQYVRICERLDWFRTEREAGR